MEKKGEIGLIGLAVMGQNLALNLRDHGFSVVVFNRTVSKVDDFLQSAVESQKNFPPIQGAHTLEEFVGKLAKPRKILLMVKAGDAVDEFIDLLLPHLEKGDILIDGGNSFFKDTTRRVNALKKKEILYVGAGISGGEVGARSGPSVMPGGNSAAWPHLRPILQAISAKVEDGTPCCDWVGEEGSGHFVKMVHNGIEYGDMQLISEAYFLLKETLDLTTEELSSIFAEWNQGELESYLIEITSEIFQRKDVDGAPLIDKILDVAGQKGTGRWTSEAALELGIPLTLISEAVFARQLTSRLEDRSRHAALYPKKRRLLSIDRKLFIDSVRDGLMAAKFISYAQGFMLMKEQSETASWRLNLGAIALLWRGGCIIRSSFLGKIKEAFDRDPSLFSLLQDPYFVEAMKRSEIGFRRAVAWSAECGIWAPCMSSALAFFDGITTARLPANLIQAQRDFFGAHTYERIDRKRGEFFHTDWAETGSAVSSSSYNA